MADFLMFRSFIAHSLAKLFFYLILGLLVLGYLGMTGVTLFTQGAVEGLVTAVVGFFGVVIYAILLRISTELMIVIFEIHGELKEMNSKM